jgi:hypothetical protein
MEPEAPNEKRKKTLEKNVRTVVPNRSGGRGLVLPSCVVLVRGYMKKIIILDLFGGKL